MSFTFKATQILNFSTTKKESTENHLKLLETKCSLGCFPHTNMTWTMRYANHKMKRTKRKYFAWNFRKFAFGTRPNGSRISPNVLVNIQYDVMHSIHLETCSEWLPNFGEIFKKFPASNKQSWWLVRKVFNLASKKLW